KPRTLGSFSGRPVAHRPLDRSSQGGRPPSVSSQMRVIRLFLRGGTANVEGGWPRFRHACRIKRQKNTGTPGFLRPRIPSPPVDLRRSSQVAAADSQGTKPNLRSLSAVRPGFPVLIALDFVRKTG